MICSYAQRGPEKAKIFEVTRDKKVVWEYINPKFRGAHEVHVHLLAAVPNAAYLEVHGFGLEQFIAHPLEMKDGRVIAPDQPGHGIEFDWEGLGRYRVN